MRVGDRRRELRLTLEAGHPNTVLAVVAIEDLERDMATKHGVFCVKDAAHAALAELTDNREMVKPATDADPLSAMGARDLAVGFQGRDVNDAFAGRTSAEVCRGVF